MASANPSPPAPKSTPKTTPPPSSPELKRAVKALESFQHLRNVKQPFDLETLENVGELLENFIKSPNNKTPPGKRPLRSATAALLHPNARPLSEKWTKPQLAAALQQWVMQALLLPEPHLQNNLYLEIIRSSTKPKHCEHTVFREDEDGSIASFALASPELPAKKSQKRKGKPKAKKAKSKETPASALPSAAPAESGVSPVSLHSASSFMRELEDLAKDVETVHLANSEGDSPDPGVPIEHGFSSATTEVEDLDAVVPLASKTPVPLVEKPPISSCPPPARKKKKRASPSKRKAENKINKQRGSCLHAC